MLPAANAANESAPLYRGWKRILPVSRSPRSRARSRARALPGLPAFPGQGPGASVAAAPAPPRCPAQGFWATVRQGSSVPLPCLPPCFLQERVHPPALLLRAVLWHLLQMELGSPRPRRVPETWPRSHGLAGDERSPISWPPPSPNTQTPFLRPKDAPGMQSKWRHRQLLGNTRPPSGIMQTRVVPRGKVPCGSPAGQPRGPRPVRPAQAAMLGAPAPSGRPPQGPRRPSRRKAPPRAPPGPSPLGALLSTAQGEGGANRSTYLVVLRWSTEIIEVTLRNSHWHLGLVKPQRLLATLWARRLSGSLPFPT
uniref:basic proline-rich protein-like isoform X1 n=1 Tax=Nyctereutes procyonoides TaxID=34880 RepID=UPI002444D74C|nr:basic proline-rich protein-like isoform X1 [Nyctereutes procyonoides]